MRVLIVAVLAVVLVAAIAGGTYAAFTFHSTATSSIAAKQRPATHAVVFVLQGVTPEDIRAASMPNLSSLVRDGVSYSNAWVGQMQPSPQASNATIATGLYPRRHGVLGPVWRDPSTGKVVHATNPRQIRLGLINQTMAPRESTPLAALIRARYPNSRILSVGGMGCSSASAAGTWVADYVLCPVRRGHLWSVGWVKGQGLPSLFTSVSPLTAPVATGGGAGPQLEGWTLGAQDAWITDVTQKVMKARRPRLTIVNYPEVAAVAPWLPSGERKAVTARLLAGIDRGIGKLIAETRAEGTYDGTVFVVTSDAPLAPGARLVRRSVLDESVLAAGAQSIYLQGAASAMIALQNHLQVEPVAQSLQAQNLAQVDAIFYRGKSGLSWTYRDQYMKPGLSRDYGQAVRYLLSTLASASSPDVVVVYGPATGTGPATYRGYTRTAWENGIEWPNQHIPLVIAGQGVLSGATSLYPARLVDIAPTLIALLHLPPGNVDGNILADAMTIPPAGAPETQSRVAHALNPQVRALQARSGQRGS